MAHKYKLSDGRELETPDSETTEAIMTRESFLTYTHSEEVCYVCNRNVKPGDFVMRVPWRFLSISEAAFRDKDARASVCLMCFVGLVHRGDSVSVRAKQEYREVLKKFKETLALVSTSI